MATKDGASQTFNMPVDCLLVCAKFFGSLSSKNRKCCKVHSRNLLTALGILEEAIYTCCKSELASDPS
jgi:hypothetical protein